MFKNLIIFGLILFTSSTFALDCKPETRGTAEIKSLRNDMFTVTGKLSGFDPCNSSVEYNVPKTTSKPPLMIYVHGGGGKGDGRLIIKEFYARGMATLIFDAYIMNGFEQGYMFWGVKATNESRQRMIYKVALEAYQWAKQQHDIDTSQIYIYGLSNGAAVALNLASVVDPKHVKTIFAEGTPGMGIGLPDTVQIPIKIIYGELDNYGSTSETNWQWNRTESCYFNKTDELTPKGNAQRCRFNTQSPADWMREQEAKGADIDTWVYKNAAHWIFYPNGLNKKTISYATSFKYAWVGADPDAQLKLILDVMKVVNSK